MESDLLGAGRRSDPVGLCPILKVRLGLGVRLGPSESDPSGTGPCAEPTALGRTLGSESDFVVSDSDRPPLFKLTIYIVQRGGEIESDLILNRNENLPITRNDP